MPPEDVRLHPHILDPTAAVSRDFKTPRPGRGTALSLQARDRAGHAAPWSQWPENTVINIWKSMIAAAEAEARRPMQAEGAKDD